MQAGILSKRSGQINGKLVSIQNRIGTNGIARSHRSLINIKRTAIRKLLLKASNFLPVAVQLVIQASSIAVDFHEQIRRSLNSLLNLNERIFRNGHARCDFIVLIASDFNILGAVSSDIAFGVDILISSRIVIIGNFVFLQDEVGFRIINCLANRKGIGNSLGLRRQIRIRRANRQRHDEHERDGDGQSFLLTDANGVCVENLEEGNSMYLGETLEIEDSWKNDHKKRMISLKSDRAGLYITGMIGSNHFLGKFSTNSILILLIMVLAIGCDMILLHYIHREIHRPLDHLMQTIQEIEDGDYKQRAEEDYHTEELQRLTQAFNRMMNVIVNLRIRAYDEKIQLMDTQMKYFQMQLKPHFFLNALTTIYSMSYQKRNEDIRTYIDALTKTVRYMFKGGLRLVLLKEETQHLENYFEMQQLRYPDCVFWYFDMEEAAMSWKIPQMLLHTFVENEYKYAVKIDSVLSILIQAKVLLKEGEEMLYIRMEDDGVGFPEQVMQYMNFESEDPSREGHHVGLWNIKRTMEVLYQKRELIHLSNLETGGCLIEIWIPKTTAVGEEQEIKNERIDRG